jgi:hypothetical protein
VYLTLLAGSAFSSVSDIIDNPGGTLNYISAALPSTSVFFMNYCIIQLLVSLPLLSLQLNQLIYYLIYRILYKEKTLTRRSIVETILSPVTLEYGTTLPDSLFILSIGLLYWVIAPIVLMITCLIFGGTYVLFKYQYLYILVRKYESGGQYWYGLYKYAMLALFWSTITMIAYLSIKEAIIQGPLLVPLPIIIIFVWKFTETQFKKLSQNIPYSVATKVDFIQQRETSQEYSSFNVNYLKQPSLTAPKYVRPYPYRLNNQRLIDEHGLINPIYWNDNPYPNDGNDDDNDMITLERRSSSVGGRSPLSNSGGGVTSPVNNPVLQAANNANQKQQQQQQAQPQQSKGYTPPIATTSNKSEKKK